ncbi:hypothetical protein ACO0RG_003467 [Hanseniaspora osmophila]
MSILAISVEETNRIRQYFGLKLLPLLNSDKDYKKDKSHGSKQKKISKKDGNDLLGNYDASNFIDTSLFKKNKLKPHNKGTGLKQRRIDEDDSNDVAYSSDWLGKLAEKETQIPAIDELKSVKSNTAKIKSSLANNIIMTLKEQDILGEQNDSSNPKNVLTVEKEFETKNFADVSQSSKFRKRKIDSKQNEELQAAKKNKKVKIEGKVRVSFGSLDNSADSNGYEHEPSDYMPAKIKKRKAKMLSQKPKSSLPHFEIKKVDLIDDDDPEEENGALDEIISSSRIQNVSTPYKVMRKDSTLNVHLRNDNPDKVQYEDHSEFFNLLKAPVLETGNLGHSHADVETEKLTDLATDEKIATNNKTVEKSISEEPNFYDGMASTLQFLSNSVSTASNSNAEGPVASIPLPANSTASSLSKTNVDVSTTKEKKPLFSINLKYTDDVTGEDLDPKKAFRQFNKNYYKAKKKPRSAKPK